VWIKQELGQEDPPFVQAEVINHDMQKDTLMYKYKDESFETKKVKEIVSERQFPF
jgi:hypothetical protein